jgi:hypothetical protein
VLLEDLGHGIDYFEKNPMTHQGTTGGFNHG